MNEWMDGLADWRMDVDVDVLTCGLDLSSSAVVAMRWNDDCRRRHPAGTGA